MTTMDLAANIKQRRDELGLSQEAAARRVAEVSKQIISVQTWRRWERGETNIPSDRLPIIAQVLETTPDALWAAAE